MPHTSSRRIDRRARPRPDAGDIGPETIAPPRTELEDSLAVLWRELLGRERIGIHDNFFELGGHSLLASQLASRARSRLQVPLPLRLVFEAPTIAQLADHIETLQWAIAVDGQRADALDQEDATL